MFCFGSVERGWEGGAVAEGSKALVSGEEKVERNKTWTSR